ncbi:MAG: HAD family phosphatase [Myxococcales bacterium]|nr:HAD family phosphatase [Myxococcales bacterium]
MARAFVFDLDGTLVDSERENAQSIEDVLGARGRVLSDEERRFVVGHGWREIYQHLHAAGGVDLSFDALKDAAAEAKERACEHSGLRVLPGAVAYVRRAALHGPCTIVSGSSRREVAWAIDRLDLRSAIPWFIAAEDVAHGKPDPEGYLAAAARLGVAPAECVVFEDSNAGIAAAVRAGMHCVALAVGNFLGQDQSSADLLVETFEAIGDQFFTPAAWPPSRR